MLYANYKKGYLYIMKKIIVAYASYGGGHKTVATYVADYIKNHSDDYEIMLIDLLDNSGRTTTFTVNGLNYIMHHKLDKLFSFLYKSLDHNFTTNQYKKFFKKFVYNEKMAKVFVDFQPDVVISSHFYGSNMAAYLNKQKRIKAKLITIVTDYEVHKIWTSSDDKNENFIVANKIVKDRMIERGCCSNNIYPYGIPFDEKKISELPNKEVIYKKFKLDPSKPVLSFFGGGSIGSVTYLKYLKALLKVNNGYQIVFFAGKCEELKTKADEFVKKYPELHVLGFTKDAYELMDISTAVIGKPGGATVTECLELQKYMILIPGVGGQETYNAKFVSKNRYGIYLSGLFKFKRFIKKFMNNPKSYLDKYNNKKLKNESLKNIKELVDKLVKENKK